MAKGSSVENNYDWKSKPTQQAEVDGMVANINTEESKNTIEIYSQSFLLRTLSIQHTWLYDRKWMPLI